MKKGYAILLTAVIILVLIFPEVNAQSTRRRRKPRKTKPDLTAAISLKTSKHYNSNGNLCYTITPTITIANAGSARAENFNWKIEWISGVNNTWYIFSNNPDETLEPGSKLVMGGTPDWNLTWCTNETEWKASWRVTLDEGDKIDEYNEDNNIIEKIFYPQRKNTR